MMVLNKCNLLAGVLTIALAFQAGAEGRFVIWNNRGSGSNGRIIEYASYADLLANNQLLNTEVSHRNYEGLATDGERWVLYEGADGSIKEFPTLQDVYDDTNGTSNTLARASWEGIASDGVRWCLYDSGSGDIWEFASFADMLADTVETPTGIKHLLPQASWEGFGSDGIKWYLWDAADGDTKEYASFAHFLSNDGVITRSSLGSGLEGLAIEVDNPDNNLVCHYQFEDDGADLVSGADGAVGSNVTFTAGKYTNAATFGVSGVPDDDVISIPQGKAFAPGRADFTMAFWVKRAQADTADADGIFDALNSVGTGYMCMFRTTPDMDKIGFRLDDNAGNDILVVDPSAVTDTVVWHHFALVVSRSTDSASLYRDGILVTTVDPLGLTGAIIPDKNLDIGCINYASYLGLDGSLDDLRFYVGTLTAEEVLNLAGKYGGMIFVVE